MKTDLFGIAVSTTSPEALHSWNRMQMRFLAHGADTGDLLGQVLAHDPGLAVGHAVKGLFLLLLGRRETVQTAHEALAAAHAAVAEGHTTARERAYVAALADWIDGSASVAALRIEAILRDTPGDALAAKLVQAIRFVLGDIKGMRSGIETALPGFDADHPAQGYMMGCQAFALEETGAFARAERIGRFALTMAPDDAWGLHAVAHVHDMTARARDGLDWLDANETAWSDCNNFRYHVWWHKALMYLDLGQTEAALALYDSQVRADRTDDYRDIANAASLLMRLELDGVAVADRWQELATLSAARTDDACLIFADLHYLMALIGGGRADMAARMIARIRRDATAPGTEAKARMAAPGLPAARALAAFGAGDHATAHACFMAARPAMILAGGSHAQRDVFERMTIDSALRAGSLEAARTLLAERQTLRGGQEDGYAAARRTLISAAMQRSAADLHRAAV